MTESTRSREYAEYLIAHQESLKGKLFQLPYQSHLRLLRLGKTLDIGCGAGRNLRTLSRESVGVDHNVIMIESCRKRGMKAFTAAEWESKKAAHAGTFDSILFSHVAEHMTSGEFEMLLRSALPALKKGGRVVVICPQEAGYASDQTHVEFMDFEKIGRVLRNCDISLQTRYSFPFPRPVGKFFPYNEFVSIGSS